MRRLSLLAIAALLGLAAAAVTVPRAVATATSGECRYVAHSPAGARGNVLLITLNQSVGIRRKGSSIGVYERSGLGSEVSCSGRRATIHSIDRIDFRPPGGGHNLTVDESGGRFEPGASPESGGEEIEIVAVFPRQRGRAILWPGVRIWGTSGPDQIRIGRHRRKMTAINLDVGRDGRYKDADVFAYSAWPAHYTLDGREGNDLLGSSGHGPEFRGPLPESRVVLRGGDGADRIFGGPRQDLIRGKDGGDRIYARGGDDAIDPGGGADTVIAARGDDRIAAVTAESRDAAEDLYSAGPGKDTIRANNGHVESIGCGSGFDHLWVDTVDLWDRGACERPHGPGFP